MGIDVAKDEVVVAVRPSGAQWTAANDERGVEALAQRLAPPAPTLIVLEATGGSELQCVAELAAGGLPVVVGNPRQVWDVARAR